MSKEYVKLCKTAYDLSIKLEMHPLFDVERCLLLHSTPTEFFNSVYASKGSNGLKRKGGCPEYKIEKGVFYFTKKDTKKSIGYKLAISKDSKEQIIIEDLSNHGQDMYKTIPCLIEDLSKKIAEFDWRLLLLNHGVMEELGYDMIDIINAYKETSSFFSLQKVKNGFLYRTYVEKNKLAGYVLDKWLDQKKTEPVSTKVESFLELLCDRQNNFLYDCSILILLIINALPDFKDDVSRAKTSIDNVSAFKTTIDFLKEYFEGKSFFEQLPELMEAEDFVNKSIVASPQDLTKIRLITMVKDVLNEYVNLQSSHYMMEVNDENRAEHERFCEQYDIEGVWLDNNNHYWSIQKMGDYCIMNEFPDYGKKHITYNRYSLMTRPISKQEALFTIIPSNEIQKVFSGSKMNANSILSFEVQIATIHNVQSKNIIETVKSIKVDSSAQNAKPLFEIMKRVDEKQSNELRIWWEKSRSRNTNATYYFCLTMCAITPQYIYVGSFDRDKDGYCSFFYQLSRNECEQIWGDSLYYTDFCQPVGVIRSYKDGVYKDYIANDALGYYVDVTNIENNPIKGIKKVPKEALINFLQLDSCTMVSPTDLSDMGIFSPFHYSDRHH